MAWILGIDEAGYGPNLGPFVMTLVACRVPDELASAETPPDLWHLLDAVVRRDGRDDGRLQINDSKVVHSGPRGLAKLEQGVLSALRLPGATLAELLQHVCPDDHPDLTAEVWYTGNTPIPGHAHPDKLAELGARYHQTCANVGLGPWRACSVAVCPRRFNTLLAAAGTKSAVPAYSLARLLLVGLLPENDSEEVRLYADKQGGRNSYAAQIQQGLPRGLVVVLEERAAQSVYEVRGLQRPIKLIFEPRADSNHFTVALASMLSKYLRELFMIEFNLFWQKHIPGLKSTAGYPVDAARFFEQVRPTAGKLQIPEVDLWRQK